jgi:hypothetical protein
MDLDREILGMQRAAAADPALTGLQSRLLKDTTGSVARACIGQLGGVAIELAEQLAQAAASGTPHAALGFMELQGAVTAAAQTLAVHWELLHGRPLPVHAPPAAAADAAEKPRGPQAFVHSLGECAVLAAMGADLERGEAIRRGLRAVAPEYRQHDVLYALALNFNGEAERAEALLGELLQARQEEARAACALGIVLQARGDERWRQMFERAKRASSPPALRRFVTMWTAFADSSAH